MKNKKRRDSYRGLRHYIIAILFVAAAIPSAAIGGSIYYHYHVSVRKQVTAQLILMAFHNRESIERFLREMTAAVVLTANIQPLDKVLEKGAFQNIFQGLQRGYHEAFEDLGIIDSKGDHLTYIGPYNLIDKNYRNAFWFMEVMERGIFVSDVFLGFRQVPHFVIAVKQGKGDKEWILRATVDGAWFDSVLKKMRVGRTGDAFIVNMKGYYQTRPRMGGSVLERIEPGLLDLTPFEGVKFEEVKDKRGQKILRAMTWLKNNSWLLIVKQDANEAFAELYATRNMAIVVFLLGAFLVAVVTFLTTRVLVRKIEKADEEKRALDQQLIQSQKLASIGELSAGVAHEINNPLAIIGQETGWVQDLLKRERFKGIEESGEIGEIKDSLREIAEQTGQCRQITHKLLSFARKTESVTKDVDMQELIEDVVGLVTTEAALKNVVITRKYPEHLPFVYSDPAQLRQVFLNLINNAVEAIKEKGEIRIETEMRDADSVSVRVSDTGSGIQPENLTKIFDPFFTTKPPGKGTGLGLSICHGIIEKLGGKISVTSEVGKGTTFSVDLPIVKERGEI